MNEQTKLPAYIERAINSKFIDLWPYNFLNMNQWKELATHIYEDEKVPSGIKTTTFFPHGHLWMMVRGDEGHGRQETLHAILNLAVEEHSGVTNSVPHYDLARNIYNSMKFVEKLVSADRITFISIEEKE